MSRIICLTSAIALLLFATACGGGDDDKTTSAQGSAHGPSFVSANGGGGSVLSQAIFGRVIGADNNLPQQVSASGITVSGYGDASAEPSGATVRLSVSAGDPFFSSGSSSSINIQFIKPEEMQPVVDAIKAKGVNADDIQVSTFTQTDYGFGQGTAQITFPWSDVDSVTDLATEMQDAVQEKTKYDLSAFEVLFTVDDCPALEEAAQKEALEDARARAEHLGGLADLSVGDITGISEGGSLAAIYGLQDGCAALEELSPASIFGVNPHNSPDSVEIESNLTVTFAID